MSLKEIEIFIRAKQEYIEEDNKAKIILNFSLAQNIADFVGMCLNGKQLPTIQETYPELFKEQVKIEISEEKQRELSWQFYKEQMLDFANKYNAKRAKKQKEGVNSN